MTAGEDMEENATFVRVQNKDIYAKLISMELAISALNGRLDLMTHSHVELEQAFKENRGRILKLETWRNGIIVGIASGMMVGIVAVLRGLV